LYVDN